MRGIQAAMRCSPPTPVTRARPTATPSTLAAIDRFTEPKLAVEAARRSIRKLAFKAHEKTVECTAKAGEAGIASPAFALTGSVVRGDRCGHVEERVGP